MRALSLAALFAVAVLTPVQAEEMPRATVEYSADSVLQAEGMSMRTKVYHAAQKERREVQLEGQRQIMILRMDKQLSWMLMPETRQYMEMSFGVGLESSGDLAGYEIQRTVVGKEQVNGLSTTKYKAVLDSPEGIRFEGFMWVTGEGILVKMDAVARSAEISGRLLMELSNIRIGTQDPKLFEIPAGYKPFDMGRFGGM